jgi:hypothetical protein
MTRYAKGTPQSVMKAMDAQVYGTKKDKTAPLPKMTSQPVLQKPAVQKPAVQQPKTKRGLGSAFMAKGGMAVKAVAKKKK